MVNFFNLFNTDRNVPVIDSKTASTFPYINEECLMNMDIIASCNAEFINMFPFVRENSMEERFLDIYVFADNIIQRFILLRGYKLSKKNEQIFLSYLRNSNTKIHFQNDDYKSINKLLPSSVQNKMSNIYF